MGQDGGDNARCRRSEHTHCGTATHLQHAQPPWHAHARTLTHMHSATHAQAAVPKYMKVAMSAASGSALAPGGPPLTQAIRVENTQQGVKPSEWSDGALAGQAGGWVGGVGRARVLDGEAGPATMTGAVHSRVTALPARARPRAVALKLKITYTVAGNAVESTFDVKSFPPTL